MTEFAAILFLLLAAHAVADFPIQGSEMSMAKRPGGSAFIPWPMALGCHALIHGGAVALVTGIWCLGVIETVCHATIDGAKAHGLFGMKMDQMLHVICKVLWTIIVVGGAHV